MPVSAEEIRRNIDTVNERMRIAAASSDRRMEDIRLIAVSKRMPTDSITAALSAGQRCFGENTLQEALAKQALLEDRDIEWHFIGHPQSNKARNLAAHFDWLHTLDSTKLAKRLSDNRPAGAIPLRVLLQINIARDSHKYGLLPETVAAMAEQLLTASYPGIELRGLMTIGQRSATEDQRRAEFAALRELGADCATRFGPQHFGELSMGMSDDFELAIAEGATMVRVGSNIFGPRPTDKAKQG